MSRPTDFVFKSNAAAEISLIDRCEALLEKYREASRVAHECTARALATGNTLASWDAAWREFHEAPAPAVWC